MKKAIIVLLPLLVIVIISLACFGSSNQKTPGPGVVKPLTSPELQLTIDSAVEAACGKCSAALTQESILIQTATAIAVSMQVMATPTPTEALENLSEEKLGAAINDRVQMAKKAVSLASSTTMQVVNDGAIDDKEYDSLNTYWRYSGDIIAFANEAIQVYYTKYGGLAGGAMAPLKTVDADLQVVSRQIQVVLPILEQIGMTLDQKPAQPYKVIRQLKAAADIVNAKSTDASQQVKTWSGDLQLQAQTRISQALAVKPQKVAKNRKAAIIRAYAYIDVVKAAVTDQNMTQPEYTNIIQAGANAAASLTAHGGDQLAPLANTVNKITTQVASGQFSDASSSLVSFQQALPARP